MAAPVRRSAGQWLGSAPGAPAGAAGRDTPEKDSRRRKEPAVTTPNTTVTTKRCDIGDHDIVGQIHEARTGNWLVPGDMV